MFPLATLIGFAILGLIVGLVLGAFLFQRFSHQGLRSQDLEKRLQKAEQQFKSYQDDVTQHFEETSRKVNNLTKSYKDVHEYLASSAMKLTNPQMSRAITQAARRNFPSFTADDEDNSIEAETSGAEEYNPADEVNSHQEKA